MKLLRRLSDSSVLNQSWRDDQLHALLSDVCKEIDAEFLAKHRTALDGTTVVLVLMTGCRCFVAWSGDSRCLVCSKNMDGDRVATFKTIDHRPNLPQEAERVQQAGGVVVDVGDGALRVALQGYQERICEIRRAEQQGLGLIGKGPVALAVTRSLGDRAFKKVTCGQDVVLSVPEIKSFQMNDSYQYLVLTSDGVSDILSDGEIIAGLPQCSNTVDLQSEIRSACSALVQDAYKRGSRDNLSMIVVHLGWDASSINVDSAKRRRV